MVQATAMPKPAPVKIILINPFFFIDLEIKNVYQSTH
jgi:hypothetical protein